MLHSCLTEQLDPEEVGEFCSALSGTLVSCSCTVYTILVDLVAQFYITLLSVKILIIINFAFFRVQNQAFRH